MLARFTRPASAAVAPIARRARAAALAHGPDAFTIGGASSVSLGLWLIYEPLALIVGGLLAMAFGIAGDRPAPAPAPAKDEG